MNIAFTAIFSIIAVAFAAFGLVFGYRRGIFRSSIRFGTIAVSFVISLFAAFPVTNAVASSLSDFIFSLLPAELRGILTDTPELADLAAKLPAMLAAPIVFAILFIVISLLFLTIYGIISRTAMKNVSRNLKWAGGAVGAVAGLLCFFCLSIPTAGYSRVVTDAMNAYPELKVPEYTAYIEPIVANPINKAVGAVGGNAAFDYLTSAEIADTRISVSKEASIICKVISAASPLITEDGAEELECSEIIVIIDDALNAMSDSDIIPVMAGSVFATLADDYIKIEDGNMMSEMIYTTADLLRTTTPATFKSDITSVRKVLATLGKYDILSATEPDDFLKIIADENAIDEIFAAAAENPRLRSFIPTTMNMCLSTVTESLDIPASQSDVYNSMADELASVIYTSLNEGDTVDPAAEFHRIFSDHGVSFDEATSAIVAQYMNADAQAHIPSNATEADIAVFVKDFLSVAFDVSPKADSASVGGFTFLGVTPASSSEGAAQLRDILIGMIPAEAFGNGDYKILGDVTADQIASLVSEGEFFSSIPTLEDFKLDPATWESVDDATIMADSEAIADGIKRLVSVITDLESIGDDGDMLTDVDMSKIGAAIDSFAGTTLMNEAAHKLMEALLSSDMLAESGLITDTTSKIIFDHMTNDKNASYENLLGTVQNTALLLISAEYDPDSAKNSLVWLAENMTSSSATVTKKLITGELVSGMGFDDAVSQKLVIALHAIIDELETVDGTTDAKSEADALVELLKLISAMTEDGKSVFEDGTADRFVALMAGSDIAAGTLEAIVYEGESATNDPLDIAGNISAADKTALKNSISAYCTNNGISPSDKRIVCIEALFGLR